CQLDGLAQLLERRFCQLQAVTDLVFRLQPTSHQATVGSEAVAAFRGRNQRRELGGVDGRVVAETQRDCAACGLTHEHAQTPQFDFDTHQLDVTRRLFRRRAEAV